MRITDAEWKVMNAVWHKHPASVRDVLEMVEDETNWAYTTVKTVMNRLVAKGALSMRRRANTNLYTPLVNKDEVQKSEIRSLVDRAFDGTVGPLVHFLLDERELSDAESELLRRRLDELAESKDRSRSKQP